ncbi:MAG TPA: hypothetical protein DCX14_03665 [Flavobacteriales bacterium]|nr:hypothetical protein [Flavobacteriales bacterium]
MDSQALNQSSPAPSTDPMANDPDPARLIHGLRDTGYDFYTAAADIIDNSIAASATKINIQLQLTTDGRKFAYFGDNGIGMDEAGLFNAMKYGAKIREDLASLGKFGLGLKTASSSVCLKYSLITRNASDSPLRKLTWDLEHVSASNLWQMLDEEVTDDEDELFNELCGTTGTLVVWAKCDRLLSKQYDEPGGSKEKNAMRHRAKKLKEHCALIFHKFLNHKDTEFSNINITVDDDEVVFWNPFYPEKSEQVLPESQTLLPIQLEDGTIEHARIKAWILPHSKDMTKEENETYAKISNRGQGFYIHREGRIIHYGGYMGIWRSDDPHWSLYRVEFDFGHKLDEAFNVDVKKSQILLDPALEEALQQLLGPSYKEADNRYRRKQKIDVAGGVKHDDANKTIGETQNTSKATIQSVDPTSNEATVENNRGKGIKILTPVTNEVKPEELFITPVKNIPSGYLWEPCLNSATSTGHTTGVHINMDHDFYTKVYSRMSSGLSVEGLDLLLWAFSAAEHKNTDPELTDIWEDIREEVSSNLRKLLRKFELPS